MLTQLINILTIACCIFLTFFCDFSIGQEARIWTDITGKHQIRAKLIDVADGAVRLERPNGDISRIPLDKLSKEDQGFVQGLQAATGKNGTPAAPQHSKAPQGLKIGDRIEAQHFSRWEVGVVIDIDYKWNHVDVRLDSGDTAHSLDVDEMRYPGTNRKPVLIKPASPESSLKTVRPNYKDMLHVVADGSPKDRIPADPRLTKTLSWKPRSIGLGRSDNVFEKPKDFAVTLSPQPMAMLVYGVMGHDEDAFPRVELVDLSKRKVVASGPAPRGTGRIAMSPDGAKVATLPDAKFSFDDRGQVDFWRISGTKVDHWISFSPYVMDTGRNAVSQWSDWLDDERLFTVNSEGRLILWQVENAKAIYELILERGSTPILSPGHKYLVISTDHGIQFFKADKGDLIAVVGGSSFRNASLAFSPSGRQLAVSTSGFIDIIDVTTGKTTRSFPCERTHGWGDMAWADEDYLLTEGGQLIHVPLRLTAWDFQLTPNVVIKSCAGSFWVLAKNPMNKSQMLAPLDLPPPEAIAAVKDLDEDELLAVKPGERVSIDVQIPQDNFLAQDVAAALKAGLEDAGMKVADNQPLKLIARMSPGETTKINYKSFHSFRDAGETLSITNRIYDLELLLDGTVIWKRQAVQSAPHMLNLQEGESTQDALARVMKPTAANFAGRLPAYVVRPEFSEPLGTSRLSPGF